MDFLEGIVTYNRKNYLFQVIDQIIRLTQYPYRLIIVDNGSTDKSGVFINGIIDKIVEEQIKEGKISETSKKIAKK